MGGFRMPRCTTFWDNYVSTYSNDVKSFELYISRNKSLQLKDALWMKIQNKFCFGLNNNCSYSKLWNSNVSDNDISLTNEYSNDECFEDGLIIELCNKQSYPKEIACAAKVSKIPKSKTLLKPSVGVVKTSPVDSVFTNSIEQSLANFVPNNSTFFTTKNHE